MRWKICPYHINFVKFSVQHYNILNLIFVNIEPFHLKPMIGDDENDYNTILIHFKQGVVERHLKHILCYINACPLHSTCNQGQKVTYADEEHECTS